MADEGLRYNRFHVTAVCSPTRAAMLTGRNQHRVGFGLVAEFSGPFPGYNATIPRDCATLPRILQENGYMTAAIGKWHLTPDNQQGSSGPFNRWPTGLGFDYYWGFLGGEAGQYDPLITENQKVQGVPEGKDGEPYYFPDDMAEKTIDWLHRVRAERPAAPWFMYYATGCSHAPHHVPREWSDKYAGKFDQGWDVLREETIARQKELGVVPADTELPENDAFPEWDSLSETEQRLYARQMEVYAGYSENADWNVGRVLAEIEEMGELDNTLVIWIWGDNGASMEGTLSGTFNELTTLNGIPLTTEQQLGLLFKHGGLEAWGGDLLAPHYSSAWAWASNCPFDWGKQVASHLGGTRDPLVVRYPKDLRRRLGPQPLHARDRHRADHARDRGDSGAGLRGRHRAGAAARLHVRRLALRRRRAGAPHAAVLRGGRQPGDVQGRLVARDAAAAHPVAARPRGARAASARGWDPDDDPVELYYLPDDFAQAKNVSAEHPEKVEELRKLFWEEAERYQVLPILGGLCSFYGIVPPIPKESKFTYRGRIENVAAGMIPRIYNHSYTISADIVVPEGGAEGVIVAAFDHLGGFALYVQDGKLKHHYSMLGVLEYTQEAETPLPAGDVNVEVVFAADEPEAGDGRRGDVARERRAGRLGAHGAHRAGPLLRLRGDGHRLRQRPRRRPQLRRQGALPLHRRDQAGHVRHRPAPERRGPAGAARARRTGARGARGECLGTREVAQ